MAAAAQSLRKLKILVTEDPDGVAYISMTSNEWSASIAVRDLTLVDMRQKKEAKE